MKKLFFALAILCILMPSMAFAQKGHGLGIFVGPTVEMPQNFEETPPFGFVWGFEYGILSTNAEVWPRFSAEMTFEDQMSHMYATLGTDIILFGWLGIQPGFTFAVNQDYSNPTIVEGLSFPENEWGIGPTLEVSARVLKLGNTDYLEIRPAVAATYVMMMGGSDPEFKLRFQLNAHLKSTW